MIQKVVRGRGSLSQLEALAEKLSIKRPLIVGGKTLVPMLQQKAFPNAPVFSGYKPNPDWRDVGACLALFESEGCDGLISIGGGSAMDTAKAMKAQMLAGSMEKAMAGDFPEGGVPHIAIPGTAGSGAETTQFAVLYLDGNKESISHPALRPDGVVLDADLLATLPDYHRKSAAMDALSQGIESYWAKGATEESRVQAYLGFVGVLDNLKAYVQHDPLAEEALLEASYRSGVAIQTSRTTAAHAMSYKLTTNLGIAHGHACFLTLPWLWEHLSNTCEEARPLLQEMADYMHLGSELMVPRLLSGILLDLEMPMPAMPDAATLAEMVQQVNPERLGNHPVTLTEADIERIYRRALTPLVDPERQACLDIWRYYGL